MTAPFVGVRIERAAAPRDHVACAAPTASSS